MCNEEKNGLVLSTTQSSLPLTPGHRYRLTLDHQTAFADTYQLVVGEDTVGDPVVSTKVDTLPFPQARATERISLEFTASADADTTWIGVEKLVGGRQANLTIDDLRLEDLGTAGCPFPAPARRPGRAFSPPAPAGASRPGPCLRRGP